MEHKSIPADRAEELRAEFIPSWEIVKGKMLQKRFMADDHNSALKFIQKCMEPSVKLDHFPDVAFFYNEVLIRIYHHDSGGLVDTCFILAKAIDKIAMEANLRYDLEEAMMDVALQGRSPASPGSFGLMRSRADYGRKIEDPNAIIQGAIDALEYAISRETSVDQKIMEIAQTFKMSEGELARAFRKIKGISAHDYHRRAIDKLKKEPIKI